jgi:hypothetical protein
METQEAKTSLQDLQSLANTVLDNSDVLKKRKKKERKEQVAIFYALRRLRQVLIRAPPDLGSKLTFSFYI